MKLAQCEDGPIQRIDQIINTEQLLKQNARKRSNDVAGQRKHCKSSDSLLSPKAHTCALQSVSHISLKLPGSSISKCVLSHLTGWRTLSSSDSNDLASIFHYFVTSFLSFSTIKISGHETCSAKAILASAACCSTYLSTQAAAGMANPS